jgi:hypothetical protein
MSVLALGLIKCLLQLGADVFVNVEYTLMPFQAVTKDLAHSKASTQLCY